MNDITQNPSFGPEQLEAEAQRDHPVHPFEQIAEPGLRALLPEYAAMSEAFPLLQAGASQELIARALDTGVPVPEDVRVSSVVGAFLVWDEFGAWQKTCRSGVAGLDHILDTADFHASLLLDDLARLLGEPAQPEYRPATVDYLRRLSAGLGSTDPVRRCAMMVSFETHANRMLTALWESVAAAFAVDKDELTYFRTHVGGDDPAEAYHVAMTSGMIAKMVPVYEQRRFLAEFKAGYALHVAWCAAIADAARMAA